MKKIAFAIVGAASLALAGCGGQGDDTLGDNVEENFDNREDAIDDADVNAADENVSGM